MCDRLSLTLVYHVREKRHSSSAFNGSAQLSLVFDASPVSFWWVNLSLKVHKPSEKISVLVVDCFDLVLTKITLFHRGF